MLLIQFYITNMTFRQWISGIRAIAPTGTFKTENRSRKDRNDGKSTDRERIKMMESQ